MLELVEKDDSFYPFLPLFFRVEGSKVLSVKRGKNSKSRTPPFPYASVEGKAGPLLEDDFVGIHLIPTLTKLSSHLLQETALAGIA